MTSTKYSINGFVVTETQWSYYRFWLMTLIVVETLMLFLNTYLVEIYTVIALLFLGGLILRILKLYPGQDEPLMLDFSAVLFACLYAFLAGWLGGSGWRFLLILCSSVIIIPHFVFIAQEK